MHALLITGGTQDTRNAYIQEMLTTEHIASWDTVRISTEEKAIAISQIRDFTKQLSFAPRQSPWMAGIIHTAERMTTEAQNALLKTLEEPPGHARIYCETMTASALLPTILSRCELVTLPTAPEKKQEHTIGEMITTLTSMTPGQRLAQADAIAATRDTAKQWVISAITIMNGRLLSGNATINDAVWTRQLLLAKKQLDANVHPKLIIDHLLLQIH